ncbi:hypothetical protein [Aquabacterium sp. J223]|uniref:hypothetical protein n=1 Tax=Aquabacterium sp. J223 TaxID=2898431 RepID=UPI0021AE00C4|nr:hypothetical protein [Aquabacterium sp. J223]UUX94462.1 hypothetical protein LRS07_14210 [Aquabacterium sp. J223]
MRHVGPTSIALVAASLSCGCTIVGSQRLPPGASAGSGVAYALPMSRVPVVLSAQQGQIILRVLTPRVVPDPDHRYVAQRQSSPFGSDQVTITVDPATGFLTSVSAVGKDETLVVLEKLLLPKSTPTMERTEGAEELASAVVDPANDAELRAATEALNGSLMTFLHQQASSCTQGKAVCDEYAAVRRLAPVIRLEGRPAGRTAAPATAPAAEAASPGADCSVGICYRQPQPHLLTVALGGISRSLVLQIPNAAPLVAVPLERHAFVTTTHTLAFEQGTLTSATVDRPSSALALVNSPLAAVSGVLSSITKPLSEVLKIDTSGQYEAKAAQAKSEADTAKAKADEAKKAGGDKPPAADPNTALATLTLGTSRSVDTLVVPTPPAAASGPAPLLSTPGSSGSARN